MNERRMVRELDPTNENERGLPCVVRHPDAGGRCLKTATIRTHDVLNFCPEHGEEARIGALMEAYQDAANFFHRFRNPHVPDLNPVVEGELAAVLGRMNVEGPSDADHERALLRAYPNPPEKVREIIRRWERDERNSGGVPPLDLLLDSLQTLHKLMRLAHEDGEDRFTEILKYQRQECAARAACALEAAVRPA